MLDNYAGDISLDGYLDTLACVSNLKSSTKFEGSIDDLCAKINEDFDALEITTITLQEINIEGLDQKLVSWFFILVDGRTCFRGRGA